jgi:hypothetical protein
VVNADIAPVGPHRSVSPQAMNGDNSAWKLTPPDGSHQTGRTRSPAGGPDRDGSTSGHLALQGPECHFSDCAM